MTTKNAGAELDELESREDELLDDSFGVGYESDAALSLEDVRSALSTIRGSMDDAINELRGE